MNHYYPKYNLYATNLLYNLYNVNTNIPTFAFFVT